MKKVFPMIIVALSCCLFISACARGTEVIAKTANSEAAIAEAASMTDKQKKYNFLMNEANGFMNVGMYEDAAQVGEYIVQEVDPSAPDARRMLKKAYEKAMGNVVGN